MNRSALLRLVVALLGSLALAPAAELRRSYFEATRPSTWSEYALTSGTRSKATFRYQRQRDVDGKVVIELTVTTPHRTEQEFQIEEHLHHVTRLQS